MKTKKSQKSKPQQHSFERYRHYPKMIRLTLFIYISLLISPILMKAANVFTLYNNTETIAFTKPKHLKVPALPGDGVFSLLRRYQLDQHSCNHKQFYKINNLKKNSGLIVGRYYFIPVLLYTYNGKTIRSSIGKNDWSQAKRIELYNEMMLEDGYRQKSFKIDKILWVPYHELNCPTTDIPAPIVSPSKPTTSGEANLARENGGTRNFSIFGKAHQHVPLKSNDLRGKVFYIVGGHGGPDPGAIGKHGKYSLCEDEYAYDVALRFCKKLVEHGATAYMITRDLNDGIRSGKFLACDSDEVIWGNKAILHAQKPRLFQRSDVVNELYEKHKKQGVSDQKLIVIHVDSRNKKQQTDLFFYYHPDRQDSRKLALQLHKTMREKYKRHRRSGRYDGTVTGRDLHMLRETQPMSVYIELGNIRHPFDQQRIMVESNRQTLAEWLFEGIK